MKYDDSLIPLRSAALAAAGVLETVEQVLLMKVDNTSSVGELRRKLRLIEQFDFRLQALVDKGYVRFDSPTEIPRIQPGATFSRTAEPSPTTTRQAEELNRVLEALATEKSRVEGPTRAPSGAAQKEDCLSSADLDQAAYLRVRGGLLKDLAQDADDLTAASLLFALEGNEHITDFRSFLKQHIQSAQSHDRELFSAFERHFEATIRMAHTECKSVRQPVESKQGPMGLTCKDLDELA